MGERRIRVRSGWPHALDWLPSPAQFAGEGLGMGGAGPSAEPDLTHPKPEVYPLSHAVCGRGWTSISEDG
jgi:hypothetical protein